MKYSRYLVLSHTPLPADRQIKQINFLVSNAPESSPFFSFHSFYLEYLWVNAGTVCTCTWTCSGSNERKRIRSDVSVKDMKIHYVPQGKILNTPQKKNKSGFLIKIIIYPETLHLNSLKSSASSVDQQTRSKLYWCPAYVCAECLPVLRLSAKLIHPIPAFSNFVGEIHA